MLENIKNKFNFLCEYKPKDGGLLTERIIDKSSFVIGYIYFDTNDILIDGKPKGDNKFYLYGVLDYEKYFKRKHPRFDKYFADDYLAFAETPYKPYNELYSLSFDIKTTTTDYYRPIDHIVKVEFLPEYKDSGFAYALGYNTDSLKQKELDEFNNSLDIVNGKILLKHNSPIKITDGYINGSGKPKRLYSNNSDYPNYFWASKKIGADQSNGGTYTYYCKIDLKDFYNINDDPEQLETIDNALKHYNYVGVIWKNNPSTIACVSRIATPISFIINNKDCNHIYGPDWKELN